MGEELALAPVSWKRARALIAALALVPTPLATLKSSLDARCAAFRGKAGYCVVDLASGERIDRLGTEIFPTASTIKTAVALEALMQVEEGRHKMTDAREVPSDMALREASQWGYHFKDGTKPDLDGWLNLMIGYSDNTATIVLRGWMGIENVNARMASLGLLNTRVLGPVPKSKTDLYRWRQRWGLGMTTPREMARLFELLYKGKAGTPAASEKLLRVLRRQYWDDLTIAAVPVDVAVGAKSGAISRSRSEVAVVWASRPFVVAFYTDDIADRRWTPENEAETLIRAMSVDAWNAFAPDRPFALPKGYDKFVPTGGGGE